MCCSVCKPENGCFRVAPHNEWPFFAPKRPRIVIFGQKISFVGLACLVQATPTLVCRCPTEKKHVLRSMEAGNMVFRGRPMQKMAIFAQKWPIKSNFLAKNSVFWALVVSSRRLNPILQVPDSMEHVLRGMVSWVADACFKLQTNFDFMVWKPENRCVGAAPPKKWPFSGQKWPKIANFGHKSSIFGPGCSGQGPPTLFFRCLTRKNMCCMVLKQENGCCRAAPTQKMGIFWAKMA